MRLIDADRWIEELSKRFTTPNYHPDLGDAFQCMESEQHNEDITDLIIKIESQPTAYEVDKVVDILEHDAQMLYSIQSLKPVKAWRNDLLIPVVKGGL